MTAARAHVTLAPRCSPARNQIRVRTCEAVLLAALGLALPAAAEAQTLGTFRWQLQPYCNVLTVTIIQQGGQYTVDGTDDQCGAQEKASVRGMAFQNPNGTIGFGLTIVTAPGGAPVHVEAAILMATLNGSWEDSSGNAGTFIFTPGAGLPGAPRPVPSGGLAPGSVTMTQIAPAAVGSAQIAPNAVTGTTVANGSLTRADMADAPRALFSNGVQSITLGTSPTVHRTVTLPIPAPGVVIANASGYFYFRSSAYDSGSCSITTGTSVESAQRSSADDYLTPASQAYIPMSGTRGFTVSPGTFTVRLVCQRVAGTISMHDTSLTAMYIPQ